jgi:hypothetical protein
MTRVVLIRLEKSLAPEVDFEVVLGRPVQSKMVSNVILDLLLLGYLNLFRLYMSNPTHEGECWKP